MANQRDKKRFSNTLQRVYNLFVGKDPKTKELVTAPGKVKDPSKPIEDQKLTPIQFPDDIKKAYEYFKSNYALYNSNNERMDRYQQLEFMVRNEGLMWTACQIYAEETYEKKPGQKSIEINAKEKKVEKHFYEWLDNIGFNDNILSELAWNVTLYGDAFWLNNIDIINGVVGIVPLDPYMVKDRIEFSANNANKLKTYLTKYNFTNTYDALKDIAEIIQGEMYNTDYVHYFKSYLLGYEIGMTEGDNKGLPPWAITHFRRFTSKSEFFPFGRPVFLGSIARYESYKTTEMLIDMARSASFPKEVYEIQANEDLTPLEVMEKVDQVRMHLLNISHSSRNKDEITIQEPIYTVENLFNYDVKENRMDLDKLGDLEHKHNDLILSTSIPDTYLMPSRGSGLGGENAKALLYNNKIFQRRVETNKSAILEGISDTYRMHLAITEQFDKEKTVFELAMPVNSEMYSSEKTRQENDLLRLAKDMIDNMGQALGLDRGEAMPEPLVREVFKYFIPLDDDTIDDWFNMYLKSKEPIQEAKRKEAIYDRVNDDVLRECYFDAKKKNGFLNAGYGNKFYYNNSYKKIEEYSSISLIKKEKKSKTVKLKEEETLSDINFTKAFKPIPKPKSKGRKKKSNSKNKS